MARTDHGKRFLIAFVALSVIATPLVAAFVGPHLPPGNASAEAHAQVVDNTWLLAILTPPTIFVLLLLGYVLVNFRSRSEAVVDGPPIRGDMRVQTVWMVVTSALVLFLAGFGSYELVQSGSGGGQGPTAAFQPAGYTKAMDVQVIAQQWEFTYRYPTYGGVETPQLVIPVGRQIAFHVTSLDAIHSFWAYQLGVKADANPGVDNVAYVKPRTTRTFDIRCAELCGLWHGYMFDTGRIVSDSDFAAFVRRESRFVSPVTKDLPKYGGKYLPEPAFRAG